MKAPKLTLAAVLQLGPIIISVFFLISSAGAQPWSAGDKKVRERYYRLLDSVATATPEKQILRLCGFITAHPQIERGFLKLLERYQVQNKITAAKSCFQQLAEQPSSRRNSLWMLAKIAAIANDTLTAGKFFLRALRDKIIPPSPALLSEYIEFRYHHSRKLEVPAVLHAAALSAENQALATGLIHYQNENYDQAIVAFRQVSRAALQDGLVLHIWGDCFMQNERKKRGDRLARADGLWRRGLALAESNDDWEWQARFLTNLGNIAYEREADDEAISWYDSAYVIARRLDDTYNLQRIQGKRGNSSHVQGDYHNAKSLNQEAIKLAAAIGAHNDLTNHYLNYGQLLYEQGQYNDAFQVYTKGENLAKKIKNRKNQIHFMIKMARGYVYFKLWDLAGEILQQAHALAVKLKYSDLSHRATAVLADLLIVEGKYREAKEICFAYLKYLEQSGRRSDCHNYLAKIADAYRAEREYAEARKFYLHASQDAAKFRAERFHTWYLLELADLDLLQGFEDEAIKKYHRVLEIAGAKNYADLLYQVHVRSGEAHQKLGDYDQAISAFHRAAAMHEASLEEQPADPLMVGSFSEISKIYGKLAESFVQSYKTNATSANLDSIFYYTQMAQGRALFELRNRASLPENGARGDLPAQEYRRACKQLRSIQRRLREHPNEYEQLRASLQIARYAVTTQRLHLSAHDSSRQARSSPALPLSLIKAHLKQAGLGLLVYHTSEAVPFVLVVSGDAVKAMHLQITQLELASLIDALLEPFHTASAKSVQHVPYHAAIAHQLYRLLIEPAQKALKLPKRILIVPDLVLTNLPFEMLLTTAPDKPVYTPRDSSTYAGGFLLNQHTIFYSPAIGLIEENADTAKMTPTVLVFANPFDHATSPSLPLYYRRGWSFDALPFSESEAEQIKTIHPPANVRTRKHATESAFLEEAAQQRVVHIASHAFVDTSLDAFSGIVLAAVDGDSADDGVLMGFEIADLNLNCDLVALSACETGQGQLTEGEGVLGLPRLFLGAGAKSVLMTLWPVHDEFAAELMPKFYEQFLRRKLSKADALAKTKSTMLNSEKPRHEIYYQHPFYWAPFVLYGDPGINRGLSTMAKLALAITAFFILALPVIGVYYLRYRRKSKKITHGFISVVF